MMTIRGTMTRHGARLITARDPDNFYPRATLLWQGPGWYAAACTQGVCRIDRVAKDPACPPRTWSTGYGTAIWCDTTIMALGNYAPKVEVKR